jgi:hypothetical protein
MRNTTHPDRSRTRASRRRAFAVAIACVASRVSACDARTMSTRRPAVVTLGRGGAEPLTTTLRADAADDCDACETFMRAIERRVAEGKFQGEMAALIAETCRRATRDGGSNEFGVCVAAGEAGLRFATRYVENHPELGDEACEALEMCPKTSATATEAKRGDNGGDDDVRFDFARDAETISAIRKAARLGDNEACSDCVMATSLVADQLRANSTINFVVGEVDALCAQLGPELAHQCDAVLEPYVPMLLSSLAASLRDVCVKIGVCPKTA